MIQMTKNEYKEFLKANAAKLYKESGYIMEQYNADADAVQIKPLDLSKYPLLSAETIKWLNILFDEEDVDRKGNYMLRGFTYRSAAEVKALKCSYGDYTNGYSYFAYNDDECFIYTYCEGDTTLTLYPDKENYHKGYEETYNWYKEEFA